MGVHTHRSEISILKVVLIGVMVALTMTGCPLVARGEADGDVGSAVEDAVVTADTARGACVPEGVVCNGQDDDCDGQIDEACAVRLGGHVLGGGIVTSEDAAWAQTGQVATRHFVGVSSDDAWVIRGGLPVGAEGP